MKQLREKRQPSKQDLRNIDQNTAALVYNYDFTLPTVSNTVGT